MVVAGHNARTFVGFRDDADTEQFIRDIKRADTEYKPVDYLKYVNYEVSKPGLQVMLRPEPSTLPAATRWCWKSAA